MITSSDILNASILIVDDQAVHVCLLERMLRGAGHVSIASTSDPQEVCELHRKNRYSLILLDLEMPGLDGFQVMKGLKAIEAEGYLAKEMDGSLRVQSDGVGKGAVFILELPLEPSSNNHVIREEYESQEKHLVR